MFPSPSRGSYFSISWRDFERWWKYFVSVPFPGILFLNMLGKILFNIEKKSFRPLPGDLISQFTYEYLGEHLGNSFRPLPGDLISQSLYWIHGSYISKAKFPSPSRGSYFSIISRAAHTGSFRISFPSPSRGSYFSILSFTCLILTGFQSRIAVQNQIRLWNKLLSP